MQGETDTTQFKNGADVYDAIGHVLAGVVGSPGSAALLVQFDGVVAFDCSNPDAVVTLDLRAPGPFHASFGPPTEEATTQVIGSTDAVDRLLLGEANVFLAMDDGELQIVGREAQLIIEAVPQIQRVVAPIYADRLWNLGYTDRVDRWFVGKRSPGSSLTFGKPRDVNIEAKGSSR
jgi:hypothetical protein